MNVKHHNIPTFSGAMLLLILAAAPLFLSLAFLGRQAMIRHDMEERLEKEALTTIFVPRGRLYWVKKDKEIQVGKDLFDVKKIVPVAKGYLVTGLYDYDEKHIHRQLSNAIEGQAEEEQQDAFGTWLFKQQYTCPDQETAMPVESTAILKLYNMYPTGYFQKNEQKVPTPPPRHQFS